LRLSFAARCISFPQRRPRTSSPFFPNGYSVVIWIKRTFLLHPASKTVSPFFLALTFSQMPVAVFPSFPPPVPNLGDVHLHRANLAHNLPKDAFFSLPSPNLMSPHGGNQTIPKMPPRCDRRPLELRAGCSTTVTGCFRSPRLFPPFPKVGKLPLLPGQICFRFKV